VDPIYELKAAIIARLRADASVSAFVGNRIYDRPPAGSITPPYVSLGPWDATTDDAECIDAVEINGQIDVWSWGANEAFGSAEASKIAGAIRKSLHEAEFSLTENALATMTHRITRMQRESDGATNRAIVTITAFVEVN
jgi:hypothetical protein